jgi:hypothetical protein
VIADLATFIASGQARWITGRCGPLRDLLGGRAAPDHDTDRLQDLAAREPAQP